MNIRHTNSTVSSGEELKLIVYLTAIINYHLWKVRNDCLFKKEVFNYEKIVNRLIRSVGARKNLQQRLDYSRESLRIPRMDELLSTMIAVKNITFLFDNG